MLTPIPPRSVGPPTEPPASAERSARAPRIRPRAAVVLPGSGSDAEFVRAAFAGPLTALGIALHAPDPRRGADVVAGYRAALDDALDRTDGPLLVGGVSLGAHVAARWAARLQADGSGAGRLGGLLLALPAWSGPADGAPAALAARATAAAVRSGGVAAAVAAARSGAPAWLADELERAWRGYGDGLADALEAAAAEPGPAALELAGLAAPAGVVGLSSDAVHPLAVAREWQRLLPRAVLRTATLDAFGADPAVLGHAAVKGWLQAAGQA